MTIHVSGEDAERGDSQQQERKLTISFDGRKRRFALILDKMDHLPALMTVTRFLQPSDSLDETARRSMPPSSSRPKDSNVALGSALGPDITLLRRAMTAFPLRLVQLTERNSVLMKSAATSQLIQTDSMLSLYRTFSDLHGVDVAEPDLKISPMEDWSSVVKDWASANGAQLVILGWTAPSFSGPSAAFNAPSGPHTPAAAAEIPSHRLNPFEALLRAKGQSGAMSNQQDQGDIHADIAASSNYGAQFVRRVFTDSGVDVALYVERPTPKSQTMSGARQHILFPFFGGERYPPFRT